ncbi:hypothetical protein ACQJBY_006257 [Aegilops geniculata]
MGDKGSCNGYCIDLMYRLYEHPDGKINVPHFLWDEIRLASLQYKQSFPHAPFLQDFIESIAPFPIARTHVHPRWVIPPHMADDWAPKKSSTAQRSDAQSRPTPPNLGSFSRIARFLGKAHSAMMKAFSFHYSQNHDVITRLRASGATYVSEDERLPDAPPSDFGFPSGPEWADFFDDAGGSGAHGDDDDSDDL